jgi:hypothetical protein
MLGSTALRPAITTGIILSLFIETGLSIITLGGAITSNHAAITGVAATDTTIDPQVNPTPQKL